MRMSRPPEREAGFYVDMAYANRCADKGERAGPNPFPRDIDMKDAGSKFRHGFVLRRKVVTGENHLYRSDMKTD